MISPWHFECTSTLVQLQPELLKDQLGIAKNFKFEL